MVGNGTGFGGRAKVVLRHFDKKIPWRLLGMTSKERGLYKFLMISV